MLATLLAHNKGRADKCVWYFINIFVDTTIGVVICYLIMRIINKLAQFKNWKLIQSGMYYEYYESKGQMLPRVSMNMYFCQLLIWICVVTFVSKIIKLGKNCIDVCSEIN